MTSTVHYSLSTHNGCITVSNPATGDHRTFRVRTQQPDSDFAPGKRVIALLTGPDNTSNYRSFGFVNEDGSIRLFKKTSTKTFAHLADIVSRPEVYQEKHKLEYRFEGRCRVCNRKLTDPTSIDLGIGPQCRGER